jgi:hypothetical protein
MRFHPVFIFNGLSATENGNTSIGRGNSELTRDSSVNMLRHTSQELLQKS